MRVSYNKFFHLLLDKKVKKGELCKKAGISTNVVGKMAKEQNITVDMLARICNVLGCTFDDVAEILPDEDTEPAE